MVDSRVFKTTYLNLVVNTANIHENDRSLWIYDDLVSYRLKILNCCENRRTFQRVKSVRSKKLPAALCMSCKMSGRRVTIPEPRGKKSLQTQKIDNIQQRTSDDNVVVVEAHKRHPPSETKNAPSRMTDRSTGRVLIARRPPYAYK